MVAFRQQYRNIDCGLCWVDAHFRSEIFLLHSLRVSPL